MRIRFLSLMTVALLMSVSAASAPAVDVTINAAQHYQSIEGFGTCLVAWVPRFTSLYRTQEFQKIYVEGLGFNMLHVNMWGPTFEKPMEDWTQSIITLAGRIGR